MFYLLEQARPRLKFIFIYRIGLYVSETGASVCINGSKAPTFTSMIYNDHRVNMASAYRPSRPQVLHPYFVRNSCPEFLILPLIESLKLKYIFNKGSCEITFSILFQQYRKNRSCILFIEIQFITSLNIETSQKIVISIIDEKTPSMKYRSFCCDISYRVSLRL